MGVRKKRAVAFDTPAQPGASAAEEAPQAQGTLARTNSDDFQVNAAPPHHDDSDDDDDNEDDFGGLATDREDRRVHAHIPSLGSHKAHYVLQANPP